MYEQVPRGMCSVDDRQRPDRPKMDDGQTRFDKVKWHAHKGLVVHMVKEVPSLFVGVGDDGIGMGWILQITNQKPTMARQF